MYVGDNEKAKWGSQFSDRKDYFDDDNEIVEFIKYATTNQRLKKYIEGYLNVTEYKYVAKPKGTYDVDLGITDNDGNLLVSFDLERWSAWDSEFPSYYRCVSFLEKKARFITDVPFLMVWLNKTKTKYLITDGDTIKKYKPIDKYFKFKNITDKIRELKHSDAYVFGDNLTNYEKSIFRTF